MQLAKATLPLMIACGLQSCGTAIPDMQEIGRTAQQEVLSEIELVQLIECELHVGVSKAIGKFGEKSNSKVQYPVDWLAGWEAKVSLKITVDEKGALAPGVTFTEPRANAISHFNVVYGQSFSLTAGLQASSQATRVETIAYTVPFKDFSPQTLPENNECKNEIRNKVVLDDLKIDEFVFNKAWMAALSDSVSAHAGAPYSVLSDQLTFIVTYGGNITPVWKLMRVTANSNSPLYAATRTRTHDIAITLGKTGSGEAAAVHNAQLIGQAVATALRNE